MFHNHPMAQQIQDDAQRQLGLLVSELQTHRHVTARAVNAGGPVLDEILVALDFSPWSAQAVTLARRVAPHARLLLFNASQVPFEEKLRFAGVAAATIERYRRQARADATQRVHALAAAGGLRACDWEPCIVEGDASQRIVEHAQEKACDLVVLGKHGQSATEDLLLGSVSKHVLAEGSTDVLVSTAREA